MVEIRRNSKLANQVYLLISVLSIAFMSYYVFRMFRFEGLLAVDRRCHTLFLIGFIILVNFLNIYAKNNGGYVNPMRSNKKARVLNLVAIALFVSGILFSGVFRYDHGFIYLSVLSIPMSILATFIGHNGVLGRADSDLIDDFDLPDRTLDEKYEDED